MSMGTRHYQFPKPRETGRRQERVAQIIKKELAYVISQDRRLETELPAMTSITMVEMSPNLRSCTVYVTGFEDGSSSGAAMVLERRSAYLRARLSEILTLRVMPTVRFKGDNSIEARARVDALLASAKAEEDPSAQGLQTD